MIELNVLKNQLTMTEKEQITSGSVNVYYVHFHFSSHWDDLERVAVFKTPTTTINVPIIDNVCVVPWEVTTTPGFTIRMGVYGIKAGEIILPTIWTNLATVVEGVFIGDAESGDHTPDVYDAILQKMQDLLDTINDISKDVDARLEDIPTDDEIFMIIRRYLTEYPPTVDPATLETLINNYFNSHPIETITKQDVLDLIKQYVTENQVGLSEGDVTNLIKQYISNNQIGVTEERVQEMINASVGAALSDGY